MLPVRRPVQFAAPTMKWLASIFVGLCAAPLAAIIIGGRGPLANWLRLSSRHVIRIDVVRVASFYLHKRAGIASLPGDPPPR
jgi:hypothetical protein